LRVSLERWALTAAAATARQVEMQYELTRLRKAKQDLEMKCGAFTHPCVCVRARAC
jgi:hypothetical protein